MKLDYLKKRFHPEHTVKFCRFDTREAFQPERGMTGYELVAELAKVAEAREALDSVEKGIRALLSEAEAETTHPLAYGMITRDGELEVFRAEDWTEASALRLAKKRSKSFRAVPLYTEDEIQSWLTVPPKAWGYKHRSLGPDVAGSYRAASLPIDYIGYPVPLFNDEQIAAWKDGTLDRETAKPRTAPEFEE